MRRNYARTLLGIAFTMTLLAGCVERRLTINTEPQGAMVVLNDQEIGTSPVTVSFNWYGDYWVRLSKNGYEALDTHRQLKAPVHDYLPFDFIAGILYPGRIIDAYEWTFALTPQEYPAREQLVENGESLRNELEP